MVDVTKLTGVYQANGSFGGEVAYVVGRLLGRSHCALCEITHGSVKEKASWKTCRESLDVPFDAVHLDERSAEVMAATDGRTPCVVAHSADGLRIIVDAEALERCAGSPEALVAAISDGLARL